MSLCAGSRYYGIRFFEKLLPAAEEYGEHHLAIYGLIAGMAVMALSLLLFA